jgi:hypothetical protein
VLSHDTVNGRYGAAAAVDVIAPAPAPVKTTSTKPASTSFRSGPVVGQPAFHDPPTIVRAYDWR